MPIYEYYCQDCQNQFDLFFKSFTETESAEAVCPNCSGVNVNRLISNISVLASGKSGSRSATAASSPPQKSAESSKELASIMRQAQDKAGQSLGNEFKEVASRLERGEKANSVEKTLRKRSGQDKQIH